MKKLTKIVNIFGGPGIGKSGIAAGVYARLKQHHFNTELVTEVAKDYVWEERFNVLTSDQLLIFAQQHRRLDRLRNKVDFIVTDCPILLCIPYIPDGSYTLLEPLMVEAALSFNNMNFLLDRTEGTHSSTGRYHNLNESLKKDAEMWEILEQHDPTYSVISVDNNTVDTIFSLLKNSI